MFNISRRISKLESDVAALNYCKEFVFVKRDDIHKLQDLVCQHKNWKQLGIRNGWQELQCEDCGKIIALACIHGGSVACQECVDTFIKAKR